MKKLANSPDDVIAEALRGIDAVDENVRINHEDRVTFRAKPTYAGEVTAISGGSPGHEPLHGGFVGIGVLDTACTGQVFTSPTPSQMLAATVGADADARVLHVMKNHAGDVMDFEMAAELAVEQGACVETVVVTDNVTVEDPLYITGRRGIGLTVLLKKIVGAAAEESHGLNAVVVVANKANENGRSMGMALTFCTTPAVGEPIFNLPEDQMEIGVGIHGEPGRHHEPLAGAKNIARRLVEPILADHDFASSGTIVMVNGMDDTPSIESYLMYGEVKVLLDTAGVRMARNLVNNYIIGPDMVGCSVTVLRADNEPLALWDAPVRAARLRRGL